MEETRSLAPSGGQGSSDTNIRVLQLNARNARIATELIVQEALEQHIQFVCIQEPYTTQNRVGISPTFTVFQKTRGQRVRSAIVLLDTSLRCLLLDKYSNEFIVTTQFTSNLFKMLLVSVYFQPGANIDQHLDTLASLVTHFPGYNILITGDVNAHSEAWQSVKKDSRGEDIVRFLNSTDLHVLNRGHAPTFEVIRSGQRITSRIDVSFCNSQLLDKVVSWRVINDLVDSDHHAIITTIAARSTRKGNDSTFKYVTKNMDTNLFTRELALPLEELSKRPESLVPGDIEQLAIDYVMTVQSVCDRMLRQRTGKAKPRFPWWSDELHELKSTMAKAKRKFLNGTNAQQVLQFRELYLQAKNALNEAVSRAKTMNWKEFCSMQGRETAWSAFRRVVKVTNKPKALETVRVGDRTACSSSESAEMLAGHFFPDDCQEEETDEHKHIRAICATSMFGQHTELRATCDQDFTEFEVASVIESFSDKKAPGEDSMDAKICQAAFKANRSLLTHIYNECLRASYFPEIWKKSLVKVIPKPGKEDYADASSLRPIGLISIFGKALEKLKVRRLTYFLRVTGALHEKQYGFLEQKSTEQALDNVVDLLQSKLDIGLHTIVISLDIKGAFDHAWHPYLFQQLQRKNCPPGIYALTRSYYSDRLVKVRYCGSEFEKPTNKGSVQGSVCGPIHWNIIMDGLLSLAFPSGVHAQAFADDGLVVISAQTAIELQEKSQRTIDLIAEWGKLTKLTFSESKTQVMFVSKKLKFDKPALHMNGELLPYVKHFKLLGVIIDHKLHFTEHVKYIAKKSASSFQKLCQAAKPTWGLCPEVIRTMYIGALEPLITYAARVWGTRALKFDTNVNRLNSIQRGILIRMCKAYRTVSAHSLLAITGLLPLDLKIRSLCEIGKVKRQLAIPEYLPPDADCDAPISVLTLPPPPERYPLKVCIQDAPIEDTADWNIYTDGSKTKDGCGFAFLVINDSAEQIAEKRFKARKYCSVYQTEQNAIVEALRWCQTRQITNSAIAINSDSQAALKDLMNPNSVSSATQQTYSLAKSLMTSGNEVVFRWVRGHAGHEWNERVDAAAKRAASRSNHAAFALTDFPFSYAKREAVENQWPIWQQRFAEHTGGKEWHKFWIRNARTSEKVWSRGLVNYEVTQLITGHGCFREYLCRFRVIDDPSCFCNGQADQDVQHIVHDCPAFASDRFEFSAKCSEKGINNITDLDNILMHGDLARAFVTFATRVIGKLRATNRSHFEQLNLS